MAGLLTYVVVRHRDQQGSLAGIRPSGIPASISTPLADLMELSPVPARPAPGFTLTDQAGHVLSLTSFAGRAVVLEFGQVASLKAVWRAYAIEVQPRGRNADVIHTSEVFFIDPRGRERYVATPMADYTPKGTAYLPAGSLAAWGQGIAELARVLGH